MNRHKLRILVRNRRKLILVTLLVFSILLSSPVTSALQSIPQSVEVSGLDRTWTSSELPEGAVVYNNLEDFVDQQSNLHNATPDVGTHSSFISLQALDGVYDTLTSDNITMPEQPIYDPDTGEFLYNQSAYESWRLDLEGGWTDVDYDEISAELCVYGGTQDAESLRVDIWDNDGWINVISDVVAGWNNISIAPSLIDTTLEMRFTGSNTGNTSVQSSWEIDTVLLHTWTTVYGSEFTQNGIIQDLGGNLSRYIASVGECNTYDEETDTWHRYLYDPDARTVKIGNLTISHLEGGALSIDGDAGSKVGKLSWYIQAYYNDQWNNITLNNYEFVGFTKTADNITMHQRFWGAQGEMNVYLTYSYFGGFKTRVDIRNDAAQAVPIRAIWAARDVSGLQDNYELLYENDVLYGIRVEDAVFSWNDVLVSDNPIPTQTVIDKPNRRAAVIFGNQSTIIPVGYIITIDPIYEVSSDLYDNYWNNWEDSHTRYDAGTVNKLETDGSSFSYQPTYGIALAIPKYAIIMSATTEVWVRSTSGSVTAQVHRLDTVNTGVLEGAAWISSDYLLVGSMSITGTGYRGAEVGTIIQKQVGLATWVSGYRIGLRVRLIASSIHTIDDFSYGSGLEPRITATFMAPSGNWLTGYGYRQGHSIDGKTGAGTLYQIEVAVEYGAGTSADGTIYCNSHCDTDFDDIRFTDGDGQTELDYWMEEKTDSDDATFWVEVTDDLGSDQVIYCYYNKTGDATTSNGTDTFLFFDDFENNNLLRWDTAEGNWGIDSSVEKYGDYCAFGNADAAGRTLGWSFGSAQTDDFMIHSYVRINDVTGTRYAVHSVESNANAVYVADMKDNDYMVYNGAWVYYASNAILANTWYRVEVGIDFTNTLYRPYLDGVHKTDQTLADSAGGAVADILTVQSVTSNIEDDDQYLDNFFIRNWQYLEPQHYTWTAEHEPPTYAPINDVAPECTNMDDGDNLYAGYKTYLFTANVSDANGYDDIEFVQLFCYDTGISTQRWMVQYLETDNSWGESDIDGNIELVTGSCAYSKSGTDIDITFAIKVEWKSAYYTNLDDDLRQLVKDDSALTDDDNYDSNYNYIARVSMTGEALTDGSGTLTRGNFDTIGGITASGTIVYYGSSTHRPPTTEVDVWVTCPDTPDPDWQATNYESSGGTFSVAVDSDDVVGLDTYTFKVVTQGSGSGGADYTYEANEVDYIADQIVIQTTVSSDAQDRLNINGNVEIRVTAKLAYEVGGIVWLGAGDTMTLDDVGMNWDSGNSWFDLSRSQASVGLWNYYVNSSSETGHGITALNLNSQNVEVIWDRVLFTLNANMTWTVIDYYVNVSWVAIYDFDDTDYLGTGTVYNDGGVLTFGTVGNRTFYVTDINDNAGYDLTEFTTNTVWCVWDDIIPSGSVAYYWTTPASPNLDSVNLIWGAGSNWKWDYNDTLLNIVVIFTSYSNGSAPSGSGGTYGSGAFGGLTTGLYSGAVWDYVEFAVNATVTIAGIPYDWEIWGVGMAVVVPHSLTTSVWFFYKDGDYYQLLMHTNYENASVMVWDDMTDGTGYGDSTYYADYEGMHEWLRDTTVGIHNCTILLNAGGDKGTVDRNYVENDLRLWYNFTYSIAEPSSYDCHIVILDNLFELIQFDTFEVYKNDSRIYHDLIQVVDGNAYKITVKNRFGDTVNETTFDADFEMVIFVNTYSFKFMNWYNGFLRVNVTRAGTTYSEIIMPMEIIEFNLFEATYTFSVDFLNGTTKFEQEIEVTNSTGYVITGDTLADVFDLVNSVWDMTTSINITVTSTNNYALTISIDLININTTIGYQLVQVLLNITNTNTTIFEQAVDLLAYLQNVNSTLFDQTVDIVIELNYISSNVTAGFISVASTLSLIDSNLYSNFTSVAATLVMLDSSLLSNFTEVSATLLAINSNLLSNFTYVLANLTGIGSNITANYLSVSAALSAIDSSLLANFTSVSATLTMIDSQLLSNFTELTSELLAVNSTIAAQVVSVAATLALLDSSLLSNFTSVSATLSMLDSQLLSNFTEVTSTLSTIGSNITTKFLSVSATLSMIDSSLLANFTSITATLSMLDSQLLSNFTELTAELLAVNSTIAAEFLSVSAVLSMLDSSLLSNFTSVTATLSMIDSQLLSNFTEVTSTLSTIGSNITSNYLSVSATLSMIDSALLSNFTDLTAELLAVNSTIASEFLSVSATLSMLDSSLLSNFTSVSATLLMIDSSLLSNFTAVTSTLSAIGSNVTSNYISVVATLSAIDSSLLSNFTSVTATLSMIDSQLLSNFTELTAELLAVNSTIGTQFLSVAATLSLLDSSLLSNFTAVSATLSMIDSSLLSNFTAVTSTLSTIGSNITSNYLSVSATLSMIDSQLLTNFTDLTAELLLVNSSIATQFLSVSATLSMLDSSLLANFTSVSATLSMIDSSLLSNFTEVTATLSTIGSNITANYLSVAATLSMLDSSLLSNFTSVSATLSMIDSQLLSNFTSVTATLSAIGTNITSNYLAVAASLSLLDSSLLSNFTSISATLSMIDSSMLSNFTSVTATLAAIGSNVTSNYLSVAATLVLIDSNLYSNFTSITATLSAMGSNITTNYLAITAELALIDSNLAANFTTIMTKLIATNSSLFIQTLAIISDLEFLNATMYLIDDPTHLNPLVLGYTLSDDYCDFTIVTNWHNASISIYDNDVLRTGPTSELLCPIRYPLLSTSGTHNLSVYIDAGTDSFWYNISYTVAEIIAFELEGWDITPHFGVENFLECFFDTTWGNSTVYVYMNETLQTSVLEQDGGISFSFWMSGQTGLHQYVFNVTSGTEVITITWDFYLPDWAETALVVRWDLWTFQDNYTLITLESNWMNCTYYVYLNGSLVATAYVDPTTLNISRTINFGTYNLTIHADGGSQTYTIKNIRYIITAEGVTYDYRQYDFQAGGSQTNYFEETYVDVEYNPALVVDENAAEWFYWSLIMLIIGTPLAVLIIRLARPKKGADTEPIVSSNVKRHQGGFG